MLNGIWFFLQRCTQGMIPYVYFHGDFGGVKYTIFGGRRYLTIEIIMEVPADVYECNRNSPWARGKATRNLKKFLAIQQRQSKQVLEVLDGNP